MATKKKKAKKAPPDKIEIGAEKALRFELLATRIKLGQARLDGLKREIRIRKLEHEREIAELDRESKEILRLMGEEQGALDDLNAELEKEHKIRASEYALTPGGTSIERKAG